MRKGGPSAHRSLFPFLLFSTEVKSVTLGKIFIYYRSRPSFGDFRFWEQCMPVKIRPAMHRCKSQRFSLPTPLPLSPPRQPRPKKQLESFHHFLLYHSYMISYKGTYIGLYFVLEIEAYYAYYSTSIYTNIYPYIQLRGLFHWSTNMESYYRQWSAPGFSLSTWPLEKSLPKSMGIVWIYSL